MNDLKSYFDFLNNLNEAQGFPEAISLFRGICMRNNINFRLLSTINTKFELEVSKLNQYFEHQQETAEQILASGVPRVVTKKNEWFGLIPIKGWHNEIEILIYLHSSSFSFEESFLKLVQNTIRTKYKFQEKAILTSIKHTQFPCCIFDQNEKIIFVSESIQKLFGIASKDFVKNGMAYVFDQESKSKLLNKVYITNKMIENGNTLVAPIMLELRTQQPEQLYVDVRLQAIFEKGVFRYYLMEFTDNTANKQLSKAVDSLDSEMEKHWERMVFLFDHSSDSILIHDPNGEIIDANKTAQDTFGYAYHELTASSIFTLAPNLIKKDFSESANTDQGVRYEAIFFSRQGRSIIADVKTKSIDQGNKKNYISFIRDITVRKNALIELAESESRYRSLINTVPCGIAVVQKGYLRYINTIGAGILGIERPENLLDVYLADNVSLNNWNEAYSLLTNHLNSIHKNYPIVLQLQNKRGVTVFLRVTGAEISYEHETATLLMAIDITNQKETENELRQAKILAEEEDLVKSAFLANISHELRTPINAISGFTHLLKGETDLPDILAKRYLDIILDNSHQLLETVTNLLEVSQIQTGSVKVNTHPCTLPQFFEEVYRDKLPYAQDLNFTLNSPEGINAANYYIDTQRLKQILDLLLNNAFKFTPKGFVELKYWLEDNRLFVWVRDTGVGIEQAKLQDVFRLFRQEDVNVDTRKYGGTGVGLYLVERLVNLLEGKVSVRSEKQKGSTFTLSFPLRDEKNEPISSLEQRSKIPIDWESKTILIVEDTYANAIFMKEVFKELNPQVHLVQTAKECIAFLNESANVDLILLDIQLPDMSGFELIRKIKKQYNIPVIAQTAYALIADKEKAIANGFDDYIAKPIAAKLLVEIAASHISKEKRGLNISET